MLFCFYCLSLLGAWLLAFRFYHARDPTWAKWPSRFTMIIIVCYFDGEYDVCLCMLRSTGSSFLLSSHCENAEKFWRKFLCFTHVTVIKMFLIVGDVVDAAAKTINKKIRSQHSAIFLLLQLRFLSYHSIINFFFGMLAAEFVYSRERHWNFNRRKHDEGYFLLLKKQWITPQNRTFTKVDKKIRSQCSNSLSICFFFAIYFAQLLPQIHYKRGSSFLYPVRFRCDLMFYAICAVAWQIH